MNFPELYKKFNCTVNLEELRNYYQIVTDQFEHLRWSWYKNRHEVEVGWQEKLKEYSHFEYHTGWAIQSNIIDKTKICPPFNISNYSTGDYYNTELVFGVVDRLCKAFPFAYRWSLVVQPPGGCVPRHNDGTIEYTCHIPIYWPKGAVFECSYPSNNSSITNLELPATGEIYWFNTEVDHFTMNYSTEPRVNIMFRCKKDNIPDLFKVTGEI